MRFIIAAAGFALAPAALAHETGFLVSRTETGALQVDFDFARPHHLHMGMTGLPGLATDELGFEEVIDDINEPHPAPHRLPLAQGAKIQLIFTAFDPGAYAADPISPVVLNSPGDSIDLGLGGSDFERPIILGVDPDAPGADPTMMIHTMSLFIRDLSGTHADSPVYTVRLEAMIPAPAGLPALAAGLLLVRRRR